MLSYHCACGHPIFFRDRQCGGCGSPIGCDLRAMQPGPIEERAGEQNHLERGSGQR